MTKVKQFFFLFWLLIFSPCGIRGQIILPAKKIDNIKIYATNPKLSIGYAVVNVKSLKRAIETTNDRNDCYVNFTIVDNRKRIDKLIKSFAECKFSEKADSFKVNSAILIEICFSDSSSEKLIVEKATSQRIFFHDSFYGPNSMTYKRILHMLPLCYRIGIKYLN